MLAKKKKQPYVMSRRRLNLIIGVCLSLATILIFADRCSTRSKRQVVNTSESQSSTLDFAKYHSEIFTVANVVDGDTFDINATDGQYSHTRIRLWGVDTPETKSNEYDVMYFGPEASNFTTKAALHKQVTVYLDKNRTRGKYGRLLAYVKLPNGDFLNEILLSKGYAYADFRFRHNFYYKYQQLEASARSGKKGLWGNVKREQLPEWLQKKKPKLLKNKL